MSQFVTQDDETGGVEPEGQPPWQFSLRTLLLFVTAVAVILTIGTVAGTFVTLVLFG